MAEDVDGSGAQWTWAGMLQAWGSARGCVLGGGPLPVWAGVCGGVLGRDRQEQPLPQAPTQPLDACQSLLPDCAL